MKWKKALAAGLSAALIMFVCKDLSPGILPAVFLPLASHEAGHILLLKLYGLKITKISIEPVGISVEYTGIVSLQREIIAALAGPVSGILYSLSAEIISKNSGILWLAFSADLSLLLSAFNLLPVYPLDGGRIFSDICDILNGSEAGKNLSQAVSSASAFIVFTFGTILMILGKGRALFAAGLWLLIFQSENMGIVKKQKLL